MVWSYLLNGVMATTILVTYLFAITNLDDALNSSTGFPFIYVFQQALSNSGVNALTIFILFLVIAANIDYNASTSRQTFAFARDKGFPFHSWLGAVHPTRKHSPIYRYCRSLRYLTQGYFKSNRSPNLLPMLSLIPKDVHLLGGSHSACSCQCYLYHMSYQLPPCFDKHWFICGIQRYNIPSNCCTYVLLYYLH